MDLFNIDCKWITVVWNCFVNCMVGRLLKTKAIKCKFNLFIKHKRSKEATNFAFEFSKMS